MIVTVLLLVGSLNLIGHRRGADTRGLANLIGMPQLTF